MARPSLLQITTTLWYGDVGGYSSNPYNPSQETVYYAPRIVFNYTDEANSPSYDYGAAPGFVGSYVPPNDPYQITIYFNGTSVWNLLYVYGLNILPEHFLYDVSPAAFNDEEDPSVYLKREMFSGPFVFQAWSPSGNYAEAVYNPSYFEANPYTNQFDASKDSTATLTMNVSVPDYDRFDLEQLLYGALQAHHQR